MMKRKFLRLLPGVLLLILLSGHASAARLLIPVGRILGLELQNNTVTVVSFEDGSPAEAAGVKEGDRLLMIDRHSIRSAQDVRKALDESGGTVTLTLQRGDELATVKLSPTITSDGPRLGIYLRQGITGIGTVTYYDPDTGTFGALGHGVNNPGGDLLQLTRGVAYPASVTHVRKGSAGDPGQLMGSLTAQSPIGTIRRNTAQGVFGEAQVPFTGQSLPIGQPTVGQATILSTVAGEEPREYTVEILKIYPAARQSGRNLLLKVTDPALLEATGGIVQGMSGSPIIQDGKFIGAVTHVLVNDPTTGYGIFIENMLDAAA